MSMNIRNTFIYLQTNILSPSRITIFLSFYFRNIYHTKQPRLLSFHWQEPNNQYSFSFLFSFLFFSFLFSFLSFFVFLFFSLFFSLYFIFFYFIFLEISITRSNPGAFFSLARAEQPIYFFFFFSFLAHGETTLHLNI